MSDKIEKMGDSIVQYGPHNDRINVMRLSINDMPDIVYSLIDMAMKNKYSKIFIKVPECAVDNFLNAGYLIEAHVPAFFEGYESGYFMAKYLDKSRAIEMKNNIVESVLSKAKSIAGKWKIPSMQDGFTFHKAGPDDAKELAGLYGKVFSTYPFPINSATYLCKTMEKNLKYYCMRWNGRMVGACSAEMDPASQNVELTDFATLPLYQGKGITTYMLHQIEQNMSREGMKLAYTITRATSYPINRVFSAAGYKYGGRLTNNTNICGTLESMNVWYKYLGLCKPAPVSL
jgi:putative beta-lysine N-acetyltransferase